MDERLSSACVGVENGSTVLDFRNTSGLVSERRCSFRARVIVVLISHSVGSAAWELAASTGADVTELTTLANILHNIVVVL